MLPDDYDYWRIQAREAEAEIARLRTDLAGVVAELRQALSEIEAERAARMRAEAALYERDHGEPPF